MGTSEWRSMWWAASAWQWAHGLGGLGSSWESAATLTATFVPASGSQQGPALQGMLSLAASAVLGQATPSNTSKPAGSPTAAAAAAALLLLLLPAPHVLLCCSRDMTALDVRELVEYYHCPTLASQQPPPQQAWYMQHTQRLLLPSAAVRSLLEGVLVWHCYEPSDGFIGFGHNLVYLNPQLLGLRVNVVARPGERG